MPCLTEALALRSMCAALPQQVVCTPKTPCQPTLQGLLGGASTGRCYMGLCTHKCRMSASNRTCVDRTCVHLCRMSASDRSMSASDRTCVDNAAF